MGSSMRYAAALLLVVPAAASAQSTRQLLDSAKALYEQFQVEAARPIYQRILSPTFTQQVSSLEKAEAYKYLGAAAAILDSTAVAVTFFQGALDYDPFTDLDPNVFAGAEQAAFATAKQRLFKVAIRRLPRPFLVQKDTASMHLRFEFVTTQRANVTVELIGPQDSVVLFQQPSDGRRPVVWNGLMTTEARYPRLGNYQLQIRATPSNGSTQTDQMQLRIEHIHEPLEDTLPSLDPNDRNQLLQEQIRPSEPWWELVKGAGIAAVAIAVPLAALDVADISWAPHAAGTAAIGLGGAALSFQIRRTRPQIKANVQENSLRRAKRDAFNQAVRQRNQVRLDRTKLIVTPVGIGQ